MPYTPNTDWRTTRGNPAPDAHWSGTDDTYEARAQLKAEVERNYAGAVVVGDATRKYNCHAYVHASSHAWFNDIAPFLRDDYYQFTPGTLQVGDAVVYVKDGQITHSGTITQLAGNTILRVRSKWGAMPQVEHPPTSVPAVYGNITYYLRRRAALVPTDTATDADDRADSGRAEALIDAMLDPHRLQDLWLASTPEVAGMIMAQWPEFSELQLQGHDAARAVADRLPHAEPAQLPVLLAVARRVGDADVLKAVAQRVVERREEDGADMQSLLETLNHLATRMTDDRSMGDTATQLARHILGQS